MKRKIIRQLIRLLRWCTATRFRRVVSTITIISLVAGPLSYFVFKPQATEAAWWNDSWTYRKSIALTNNTTEQTNVYVSATIDTSATGSFKANCGDLRFTKINGELLSYYIYSGCGTASTVVYINFDTFPAGSQTIYYYYGNPSAPDGFTPLLGSGSVTQANMRLSAVNGTAFVDFSSAGTLTPYLGSKLVITDSASKKLTGYIKAGGSGETYGSAENVSASENSSYETFDGQSATGFHAINTESWGVAATADEIAWVLGALHKITYNMAKTSGTFPYIAYSYTIAGPNPNPNWGYPIAVEGANTVYVTDGYTTDGVVEWANNSTATEYTVSSLVVKKVLTPSTTGVTIVSTSGGSTYNFASQEASFNYNDNYTYAVYPLAFSTEASSYSVGTIGSEEKGTGPVAYWSFDEGQGTTANDETTNRNNGTLTNMSSTASSTSGWQTEDNCVSGKCLAFDGGNDYVSAPDSSTLDFGDGSSFTVTAWVKSKATSHQGIVSKIAGGTPANAGWKFALSNTGKAYMEIADGSQYRNVAGNRSINDDNWHYVVAEKDGDTAINIYVDGVLDTSSTAAGDALNTVDDMSNSYQTEIGRMEQNNIYLFNGKIDEPKVYNYIRTAAQIKMDYNAGLAGTSGRAAGEGTGTSIGSRSAQWLTNGLVGWWKMDETSGNRSDSSGNSNTLTDTNTVTSNAGKFGNAGQFTSANSEKLTIADNAALSTGDIDFTLTGWFYLDSVSSSQGLINKWGGAGGREYQIFYSSTNPGFTFGVSSDGTASTPVIATSQGAASTGTWYFVVAWHDSLNNTINIQVNNGTVNSLAYSSGVFNSTDGFELGNVVGGSYFGGRMDEIRMYKRVLSQRERNDLYSYAPGPVAHWKMDDRVSGDAKTLYDSSGNGFNLTTHIGTGTGMDCTKQGKYGAGCFIDNDDYIDATLTGAILDDYSMGFWINSTQLGTDSSAVAVLSLGGTSFYAAMVGQYRVVDSPLNITTPSNGYAGTSNNTDFLNKWTYLTFTRDGTDTVKIYKNGVFQTSAPANSASAANPYLKIGSVISNRNLVGLIDDVKIYNYARTAEQIMEDMNARGTTAEGGGNTAAVSASGKTAVGYWKFDEGYGDTANDSSPQKNNGDLAGACPGAATCPTWTNNGKFGKALSFDGTDDYVDIGDISVFDLTDTLTVSGWFYLDALSTDEQNDIFTSGENYRLAVIENGGTKKLKGWIHDGTDYRMAIETTGTVGLNTWNYAVLTYDRNNVIVYLNGKEVARTANTSAVRTAAGNAKISMANSVGEYWDGYLDEIKIYNYALTADDIKAEYNKGSAMKLGSFSVSSTGVASSSAASIYCVPGSTDACSPPVGEWKFEEGSGITANDTSGNGNTGTLTNGPTYVAGKSGKALKLDGSNDYASVADPASGILDFGTNNFSVEAWFKTSGASLLDSIVDKYNGAGEPGYILGTCNGSLCAYIGSGGVTVLGSTVNNDNWHHGVIVRNGDNAYLYLDGVLNNTASGVSSNSASSNGSLYFGTEVGGSTYAFPGQIDDIKIYNYARTAAQVAWDYNKGGPVGYWKMDECQGTAIHDSSGKGNTGTWSGTGGGTQTTVGDCASSTPAGAWYNGRTGKRNASLNFDGTDDYVEIANSSNLQISGQISAFAWVKPTTISEWRCVFTKRPTEQGYNLFIDTDGNIRAYYINAAGSVVQLISTGHEVKANVWSYIGWVKDGSKLRIYFNGNEVINGDINGDIKTGNDALRIGVEGGSYSFSGQIDDVQIFNYALTPTQIKTLYSGGAVNFR